MASSHDTRQGYVRIVDDGSSNFDLLFFDVEAVESGGNCTATSRFRGTAIDLNLDPSLWHQLGIEIFFQDGLAGDGSGNDIVNVYVDQTLVHTGTTWEACIGARSVDRLLFEAGGDTELEDHLGNGLYFDQILVTDLCPNDGRCPPPAPEFESVGECVSTLIGENCAGLTGRGRAQCNHDQQMTCFDLFGVQ